MASLSTTEKKKSWREAVSAPSVSTSTDVAVVNPLRDYILESAKTIHRTELTMALLKWMFAVVALFFTLVLIDQWLWSLNTAARYIFWVGFIGGTGFWFARYVLPLIGRRIHPHYAARRIESTLPELKDGLITWVQLSDSDSPPPKSVLNAVGRYVAKQLKGQDVASVIDQLNPLKLAAALMGLTLLGAIYLATSPKSVPATIQRLLMPWANVAPATRVQIVSVTPGNAAVVQGSNLSIAIQVRGWQRQDKAIIHYSTDDGQTVDQFTPMGSDIEGLSYGVELGKTFGGILQPMHYSIRAGDAVAGPFAIKVQAIPLSILEQVEYIYPEYTKLSPRSIESDGRIEGPEGTRIRIVARGNQSMKSARVEFDSTFANDGSFHPEWIKDLKVDDRSIQGEWVLEVNEKRSNPSRYQYRIRSTNLLGEVAPEPVVYPMTVVADLAPEVDFAPEIKESVEVAANASIEIEVRANDPDFGLMKVVLDGNPSGVNSGKPAWNDILLEDAQGVTGQIVRTVSFDPNKLGYQAGDTIDLVLTASDNRHAAQTNKLASNVVKSRVVVLKVVSPTKSPDPKQDDPNVNAKDSGNSDSEDLNETNSKATTEQAKKTPPKTEPERPTKSSSNSPPKKPSETTKNDRRETSGKNKEVKNPDSSNPEKEQPRDSKKNDGAAPKAEESKQPRPKKPQVKDPTPKDPSPTDPTGDGSQASDQPSKDEKSQEGNQSQQPNNSQQNQASKAQDEKQNPKQQANQEQAGGNDQGSGAESSEAGGTNSGSQKSEGQKSEGKPGGSSNEQAMNDPNQQTSDANTDAGEQGASTENASDGKPPTHDGEAFERLQKILNQSDPMKSNGANSQSKANPDESNSKEPSEGNVADSQGSENSAKDSGKEQSPNGQATNDGDSSKRAQSAKSDQNSVDNAPDNDQRNGSSSSVEKPTSPSDTAENTEDSKSDPDMNLGEQPSESKGGESKDGESKGGESKGGESKGGESKGGESKGGESKGGESKGGESKGGESKGGESKGGESKGGESKGGESKGRGNQTGGSTSGSSSGASKEGDAEGLNPSASGKAISSGQGESTGNGTSVEDIAEYSKSATDLVLESLQRQRDQPDPELLKRMGWSKEQMQAFVDRWQRMRDQAKTDDSKKKEYEDMLQSLGLVPQTGTTKIVRGKSDSLRGMREEGSRIRPPESLRERFEAFRKASQQPISK